jgi:transcriptional regulator with XRE-family HTH domain
MLAITCKVMEAPGPPRYRLSMMKQQTNERPARIGDLIKEWRTRRRLSQLDLALDAGISQRHLSFVESGRSAPSREMVENLSEHLGLPLRERNVLLLSAGFAPAFAERKLSDPSMASARSAIELVLKGHEPNPALAVDRHWRLVMANAVVGPMLSLVSDKTLLEGEVNVLRVSLHPGGLAPHVANLASWKAHVLWRLNQQIDVTCDPKLIELEEELAGYPVPPGARNRTWNEADAIALPFELKLGGHILSFITTTTVFGTPHEVTLSELAIEAFYPTNAETAAAMQALAKAQRN